jgi:hypothetical protein
MLLLVPSSGCLLTLLFVVAGNAQQAVLYASRLMVISHNHPRCVDACGVGVHRARRIETDEGAIARAQEVMRIDTIRVSVAGGSTPARRSIL